MSSWQEKSWTASTFRPLLRPYLLVSSRRLKAIGSNTWGQNDRNKWPKLYGLYVWPKCMAYMYGLYEQMQKRCDRNTQGSDLRYDAQCDTRVSAHAQHATSVWATSKEHTQKATIVWAADKAHAHNATIVWATSKAHAHNAAIVWATSKARVHNATIVCAADKAHVHNAATI